MKYSLKSYLFVVCLFLISGVLILYYVNRPQREILNETARFQISADSLYSIFSNQNSDVTSKFIDQTIVVSGQITQYDSVSILLNNKIFCKLSYINRNINSDQTIILKGRCVGFDDLLEEVKLDQCHIQ